MAIASLVLGLLGLLTGCVGIGLVLALVGVVLGAIALSQIGKPGQPDGGKGLAIAGTVISGIALLITPIVLIAILLPALGAARHTARQMHSSSNARLIHQSLIMDGTTIQQTASGSTPVLGHDLGYLVEMGFLTPEQTQSPMDPVGGDVPGDLMSKSPQEQAEWVRQNADFVIVPGLPEDYDRQTIAVFGKPDRFEQGIPVTYNDNSTEWLLDADLPQFESDLQSQTGQSIDQLIRDAEGMTP